jgi:Protein of unknown function (DUF2975)
MVTGLLLAAASLLAFSLWSAFAARDRKALQSASWAMAWLATAAAVIVPAAVLATYLFPSDAAPLNLRLYHLGGGSRLHDGVPLLNRLAAFACAAIPLGVASWGLVALRRLFLLYASGDVFSQNALNALSAVSAALFWYVLASFIAEGPITAALSWWKPEGHRVITFSIGLDDLMVLFLAAVASVITRVMAEAARLADENAEFV